MRFVDWDFNAWGETYDGLYFTWEKDQLVPQNTSSLKASAATRPTWSWTAARSTSR